MRINRKFTAGQWLYQVQRLTKKGSNSIVVLIPNKFTIVCGTLSDDDCGVANCCKREEHANAKAIAAVPQMVDALEAMYTMLESEGKLNTIIGQQIINTIKLLD